MAVRGRAGVADEDVSVAGGALTLIAAPNDVAAGDWMRISGCG